MTFFPLSPSTYVPVGGTPRSTALLTVEAILVCRRLAFGAGDLEQLILRLWKPQCPKLKTCLDKFQDIQIVFHLLEVGISSDLAYVMTLI